MYRIQIIQAHTNHTSACKSYKQNLTRHLRGLFLPVLLAGLLRQFLQVWERHHAVRAHCRRLSDSRSTNHERRKERLVSKRSQTNHGNDTNHNQTRGWGNGPQNYSEAHCRRLTASDNKNNHRRNKRIGPKESRDESGQSEREPSIVSIGTKGAQHIVGGQKT